MNISRSRLTAITLFLLGTILVSCTNTSAPEDPFDSSIQFLPLSVGSEWVYQGRDQSLTIVGERNIDSVDYVVAENAFGQETYFRREGDVYYMRTEFDSTDIPILKTGQPHEVWTVQHRNRDGDTMRVTYQLIEYIPEHFVVDWSDLNPTTGTTFTNVIQVHSRHERYERGNWVGDKRGDEFWAQGVGLVEHWFQYDTGGVDSMRIDSFMIADYPEQVDTSDVGPVEGFLTATVDGSSFTSAAVLYNSAGGMHIITGSSSGGSLSLTFVSSTTGSVSLGAGSQNSLVYTQGGNVLPATSGTLVVSKINSSVIEGTFQAVLTGGKTVSNGAFRVER